MVIATDPKGIPTADADANDAMFSDTVDVTITVTAVDEPPIFTVTGEERRDSAMQVNPLLPCRSRKVAT